MQNNLIITNNADFIKSAELALKANGYKHTALVKGQMKEITLTTEKGRKIAGTVDACTGVTGQALKAICIAFSDMDITSAGKEGYSSINAFFGSVFPSIGSATASQYYKVGNLMGETVNGQYRWKEPIPQDANVSALTRFLAPFKVPKGNECENLKPAEWNKLFKAGATKYFQPFEGRYNDEGKWVYFGYDDKGNLVAEYESIADMGEDVSPKDNVHFIDPSLPQSVIKKALKEDENTVDGTSTEKAEGTPAEAEGTPAEDASGDEATPAEDKREKALTALTEVATIYADKADIAEAIASLIERIKALTDGEADTPAEDAPAEAGKGKGKGKR